MVKRVVRPDNTIYSRTAVDVDEFQTINNATSLIVVSIVLLHRQWLLEHYRSTIPWIREASITD